MGAENLLTTEEVLLLENLMYLSDESPLIDITNYEGQTVAQIINKVDISQLNNDKDYGSFMTGSDWKDLIQSVQNNEGLMNMTISATHIDKADGGGGGKSAVFVSSETGEAVVAFRGTASYEWKDNFIGGGPTDAKDGVSTTQQENALEWYQSVYNQLGLEDYSVTVTGHSKGGNKAKYITILDDTVDRCISFDGQGFSDEYMKTYTEQIAANQSKIENCNVDYDYVNLLLNDIGNTTYYKGYDYGEGGFLENHCPNTFLQFNEDGTVSMNTTTRPEEMEELDRFLNSCLRSVSEEEKCAILEMFGNVAESGFNNGTMEDILDIISSKENAETTAYIVAYLLKYEQENPKFEESIKDILTKFGMEDYNKIIDLVFDIFEIPFIDEILSELAGRLEFVADKIPDWLFEYICEKLGVKLSKDEILKLLQLIQLVSEEMDDILIEKNGDDIVISSSISTSGNSAFSIEIEGIKKEIESFKNYEKELKQNQIKISGVINELNGELYQVRKVLNFIKDEIGDIIADAKTLEGVLTNIVREYTQTEDKILNW